MNALPWVLVLSQSSAQSRHTVDKRSRLLVCRLRNELKLENWLGLKNLKPSSIYYTLTKTILESVNVSLMYRVLWKPNTTVRRLQCLNNLTISLFDWALLLCCSIQSNAFKSETNSLAQVNVLLSAGTRQNFPRSIQLLR